MIRLAALVALLAAAGIARAGGEVPPLPKDKWDYSYLEKTWSLVPRTVTPLDGKGYVLLLEFTKDIVDRDEVRKAFAGKGVNSSLIVYYFDKDNVAIATAAVEEVEGIPTGVKGEAFRVLIGPVAEGAPPIVRAAIRPFPTR